MTRAKIHHLHEAGLTQGEIARQAGCTDRTVRRIVAEPPPAPAELGSAQRAARGAGAPSKTAAYAPRVTVLLAAQPALPTVEVLRQARVWGYAAGASAFFDLVKRLRPPVVPVEPLVRFEGLPGEFTQFDFGEVRVPCADGSDEKIPFFVGRLKFSRVMHVEVTPDQKAERLARATVACLNVFGGAPKQWVYDNPRTVFVDKPAGGRLLHPYLRQLTAELHCLVEPCAPRSGNQKGAVENAVGFVKKNFFLAYPFANRADIIAQLPGWLHRVNHERPCAATGEIPAARWEQERCRLAARPIPWSAAELPLHESGVVSPTGTVRVRGTMYSVDPRYLGAPATVALLADRVRLTVNGSVCEHPRVDNADTVQRLPEHNLAMATVITAQRKQTYFKRQCLMELGPIAQQFLDRLIMRAPGNSWYGDIHRLFDLHQRLQTPVLLAAMAATMADGRADLRGLLGHVKEVG